MPGTCGLNLQQPFSFHWQHFQADALQLKISQLNFDFDFFKVYGVYSIFYVPLSASFTPLLCCHCNNCGLSDWKQVAWISLAYFACIVCPSDLACKQKGASQRGSNSKFQVNLHTVCNLYRWLDWNALTNFISSPPSMLSSPDILSSFCILLPLSILFALNHLIGNVSNIPTMQFSTGISGNTQSKLYMLSLTKWDWNFQHNTWLKTNWHALLTSVCLQQDTSAGQLMTDMMEYGLDRLNLTNTNLIDMMRNLESSLLNSDDTCRLGSEWIPHP